MHAEGGIKERNKKTVGLILWWGPGKRMGGDWEGNLKENRLFSVIVKHGRKKCLKRKEKPGYRKYLLEKRGRRPRRKVRRAAMGGGEDICTKPTEGRLPKSHCSIRCEAAELRIRSGERQIVWVSITAK